MTEDSREPLPSDAVELHDETLADLDAGDDPTGGLRPRVTDGCTDAALCTVGCGGGSTPAMSCEGC